MSTHMLPAGRSPDDLIHDMLDELGDDLCALRGAFAYDLNPIEHKHRDGFIPSTNGGHAGVAYVSARRMDEWSCMRRCADSDYRLMQEEFMRDKAGALPPGFAADPEINHDAATFWEVWRDHGPTSQYDETECDKWRDAWVEAESDVFFLIFRALYYSVDNYQNETGEDEVYFFAGVNSDFNYGRDSVSYAGGNQYEVEDGWTLKLSDITPEALAGVKDKMHALFTDA